MGGFSLWHWVIVLVIVVLVFGTKKLGNIGKDLGSAVKGFKDGMNSGESGETKAIEKEVDGKRVFDNDGKDKS